jgi:hypothetical protein
MATREYGVVLTFVRKSVYAEGVIKADGTEQTVVDAPGHHSADEDSSGEPAGYPHKPANS